MSVKKKGLIQTILKLHESKQVVPWLRITAASRPVTESSLNIWVPLCKSDLRLLCAGRPAEEQRGAAGSLHRGVPRLRGRPADQRRGARRGQRRSQGEEGLVSLVREKRQQKKRRNFRGTEEVFHFPPGQLLGAGRHRVHQRSPAAQKGRRCWSAWNIVWADYKEKH